ncbi:hypothetical protein Daesc_002086 [Daldinia eschscholtzii]|uniref:Uncharacterized protein n=1 Tax=Daldinia eschscholtzii TaxID=292717 RepID=A0AAX6MWB1_9PEZI
MTTTKAIESPKLARNLTMENGSRKKTSNRSESLGHVPYMNNEGWSMPKDFIKPPKFEGRRSHIPKPLVIGRNTELTEAKFSQGITGVNLSLPEPEADSVLGCFSRPRKLAEADRGKLNDLCLAGLYGIEAGVELKERETAGKDEDWTSEAREFLEGLDRMESVPPDIRVDEKTISTSTNDGVVNCVMRKHMGFRDWIEEASFVEASVSAPAGTRYYSVSNASKAHDVT